MNENEYYQQEPESTGINLDLKKLFHDVVHYWWIFILLVAIAVAGVRVYHYYLTPIYRSSMSIIVDAQGSASRGSTNASLMEGFSLSQGMRSMENQRATLRSYSVVKQAVDEMNIYIRYFNHGRVRDTELFRPSFQAVMDSTHAQLTGTMITIDVIDSTRFELSVEAEDALLYDYSKDKICGHAKDLKYSKTYRFGEPIITPWCAFSLIGNGLSAGTYMIRFERPDALVADFRSRYAVSFNKESSSSLIYISCSGPVPDINNEFLNTVAKVFIRANLATKNEIAENTISFIDGQLSMLSDTLSDIGSQLSMFRNQHDIPQGVSAKGSALFSEIQGYEAKLQEYDVIKSYYKYLENFFDSDTIFNDVIAPAFFNTESAVITAQLNEIMALNTEKQSYIDIYGSLANSSNREIDIKLQIARNTLLQSIQSHKQLIDESVHEIETKMNRCRTEIMALPEMERIWLRIDRLYSLNSDVFTYLLRKRSEAQIQKASNTPDHKIIDNAVSVGVISPTEESHRAVCVGLALLLPLLFFVIRQILDGKIRCLEDLKKVTNLNVISSILSNTKNSSLVVETYPRSVQAETFRLLRSKVELMSAGVQTPVVCISSSVSGEGKTFCALNIASVFGISGKRTILLGFDLRKPGLSKHIGAEKSTGLSNYIVGNVGLNEAIVNISPNFDVLPGGAIPPNPSELIASQKVKDLFEYLKTAYDVIIVDTPPMGVVSDGFQILRFCNALVFVVRQDYTEKDALKFTLDTLAEENFRNAAIILNDVNSTKSRYNSSGYGYGYGYRYGYGRRYGYGAKYTKSYYGGYYNTEEN